MGPKYKILENSTFGFVSRTFRQFPLEDKKEIALKYFNNSYKYVDNWFETTVILRNYCAHVSELYGNKFFFALVMPT